MGIRADDESDSRSVSRSSVSNSDSGNDSASASNSKAFWVRRMDGFDPSPWGAIQPPPPVLSIGNQVTSGYGQVLGRHSLSKNGRRRELAQRRGVYFFFLLSKFARI